MTTKQLIELCGKSHAELLAHEASRLMGDDGRFGWADYRDALIPALLAGAAAIDAITPRRITSDPATWPGEGERVIVCRELPGCVSLPDFATRAGDVLCNDNWHRDVPVVEFAWWLPMPSAVEG